MTQTEIQLPDELYQRAQRFAAKRELSLGEVAQRGLELFLDQYPEKPVSEGTWKLPVVNGGGLQVPLERLKDFAYEDEELRSLGS